MIVLIKNLLFTITFNSALFLLLLIGIQNSSNEGKVKFIIGDTVNLPISFILGMSFITGSFSGNILVMSFSKKKELY
tara:strand:- start:827 stop:1057 length:231 start_codon:yes stop_codon:yes gene_type:complete